MHKPLSERIRRLREDRGWTQEDLAAKMQIRGHNTITRQRITDIENGRRVIKPEELISIARIFRVRITYVLGEPDLAEE